MGWSSTTRVARVPSDDREAAWQKICALVKESKPSFRYKLPNGRKPVCCYALQGTCRFGGKECQFDHDLSKVKEVGCQFGHKCRLGHVAQEDRFLEAEDPFPVNEAEAGNKDESDSKDVNILELVRARGGGPAYIECSGPNFDDSDPLWEEVSCAVRLEDEDIGDADLPATTRERLAAAGQYHLVNEDVADEWLCISAQELRERLESASVRQRLDHSRRSWLGDDLAEARFLWEEVADTLRPRGLLNDSATVAGIKQNGSENQGAVPELDLDLVEAVRGAESALRMALELRPPGLDYGPPPFPDCQGGGGGAKASQTQQTSTDSLVVRSQFFVALRAASDAFVTLQRVTGDIASQQGTAVTSTAGQSKAESQFVGNPLDADGRQPAGIGLPAAGLFDVYSTNAYKVSEIRKSLERCLYLGRILRRSGSSSTGAIVFSEESAEPKPLVAGDAVVISGLGAASERGLNGQEGCLERYDDALGLWQVRLDSGTRLLLTTGQVLAGPAPTSTVPEATADQRASSSRQDRSRSPRRGQTLLDAVGPDPVAGLAADEQAVSVLEVAEEAARRGEHVLVHHIVGWTGTHND